MSRAPAIRCLLRAGISAGILLAGVAHAVHGGEPASSSVGARALQQAALQASQEAIGGRVSDHVLVDTNGARVRLTDYRGKPLVVSLVYTSCYHSCSVFTRYLAGVVGVARDALGDDAFNVATIGFDAANDTPERMRLYAKRQGVSEERWSFLSTDADTARALSAELGFTWFPSPKGFDHLAQVTVLDADGRVYRQVYGDRFEPPALVEPLKALVFHNDPLPASIGAWMDNVRLFCTVYDPAAGRYRFDYSVLVAIVAGAVSLLAVAVFVVHAWRRTGNTRRA